MRRLAPVLLIAALVLTVPAGCGVRDDVARRVGRVAKVRKTANVKPLPPKPVMWPLLGRQAPDAAAVRRRVVVVKLENSKAARPQSGLGVADVVYETLTEGGITRYTAIYHSRMPTRIGPVRSARLSDSYLVPQYRALLSRSGGNYIVDTALKTAWVEDMSATKYGAPYSRSKQRKSPHNLYVDLEKLLASAEKAGREMAMDPPALAFGRTPASVSATANEIEIPFSPVNRVRWTWSADAQRYQRELNGSRQGDSGTDAPYEAATVVVMTAPMLPIDKVDAAGNPTFDVVLTGSGKASVYREGRRWDGTWSAEPKQTPRFTSADGTVLTLAPGRTWIQVVPPQVSVTSR